MNTSTVEPIATDVVEPVSEEATAAPRLKAGLPWKTLTSLTIGLALLIIMAEISRLSGSILDRAGQAWSFNELAGFGSFSSRALWRADFNSATPVRGIFLAVYVAALDLRDAHSQALEATLQESSADQQACAAADLGHRRRD